MLRGLRAAKGTGTGPKLPEPVPLPGHSLSSDSPRFGGCERRGCLASFRWSLASSESPRFGGCERQRGQAPAAAGASPFAWPSSDSPRFGGCERREIWLRFGGGSLASSESPCFGGCERQRGQAPAQSCRSQSPLPGHSHTFVERQTCTLCLATCPARGMRKKRKGRACACQAQSRPFLLELAIESCVSSVSSVELSRRVSQRRGSWRQSGQVVAGLPGFPRVCAEVPRGTGDAVTRGRDQPDQEPGAAVISTRIIEGGGCRLLVFLRFFARLVDGEWQNDQ